MQLFSHSLIHKLIRFGISGGTTTLLYGLLSWSMLAATSLPFLIVHTISYALCIPVSYLLQRNFTFQHKGTHKVSIPRFATLNLIAFLVSTFAAGIASFVFGTPDWIAVLIVMITVPIASFIAMWLWVFVDKK